jgi:hypothetical protein
MKVVKRDQLNEEIIQYLISDVNVSDSDNEIYSVEIRVEVENGKVKAIHSLNIKNDCVISPEDTDEELLSVLMEKINQDLKENPFK